MASLPDGARRLFEGKPIAFMTTMRPDGRMSTNPVAVVLDDSGIWVSTVAARKKHRNLLADDRVTLCVVQPDNLNRYVEIRGRATLEADTDRSAIDTIARQYMGVEQYPFDRPGDERITIHVVIEAWSCPDIPLADDPPYRTPTEEHHEP